MILPQLAATGIEGKIIHRKTGWRVIWGPVYARSIPKYLVTPDTIRRFKLNLLGKRTIIVHKEEAQQALSRTSE